jgi:hypothetical protein
MSVDGVKDPAALKLVVSSEVFRLGKKISVMEFATPVILPRGILQCWIGRAVTIQTYRYLGLAVLVICAALVALQSGSSLRYVDESDTRLPSLMGN